MDIKLSTSMLNNWVNATANENQKVRFVSQENPQGLLAGSESRAFKVAQWYPGAQSPAAVENLTRRDAHANEKARQAFLSYVMRECGVLNKRDLPDVVRNAMKLNNRGYTKHDWDVGKGRPLTMRRVRAVMTAIESYKNSTAENAAEWRTFTDWVLKECGQDSMVKLPVRVLMALNVERELGSVYYKLSIDEDDRDGYLPKDLQRGYDNEDTLANWKTGYGRPLSSDTKETVKEMIREYKAMATWPEGYSQGYKCWKEDPAGEELWRGLCPELKEYLTDNLQIENGIADKKQDFVRLRNRYRKAGNSIAPDKFVYHLNNEFLHDVKMGNPPKAFKEYLRVAMAKLNADKDEAKKKGWTFYD